uniref:Uncharacterized protein n=1 Tax=Manihot esculenta TaxID=3983 RepID=A0A2C9VM59_MANES
MNATPPPAPAPPPISCEAMDKGFDVEVEFTWIWVSFLRISLYLICKSYASLGSSANSRILITNHCTLQKGHPDPVAQTELNEGLLLWALMGVHALLVPVHESVQLTSATRSLMKGEDVETNTQATKAENTLESLDRFPFLYNKFY